MLPQFQPLSLGRARAPFSHPDWLFEIKWDGYRALAYSDTDGVRLMSRNGNIFKSFPDLCNGLARELRGRRCVLDGEIVCLDSEGKPFRDVLYRRGEPRFYAFDILWDEHAWSDDEQERHRFRNGEDLRYLPLVDRKMRLRAVVPGHSGWVLYCDHIDGDGEGLFQLAREHDLEGVVAKQKYAPYLLSDDPTWMKIRNRDYSQWVGREELFERERAISPDVQGWAACVAACAEAP